MKKSILPAMLLFSIIANAVTEKEVKSSVKKVTVFTQAAQVFRNATVTLQPGSTDLVFSGLSQYLNPASIQAGGKGSFIVHEVKHKIKYPEPVKQDDGKLPPEILREIKFLEDSISEFGFRKDELADKKSALLLEKEMIQKNKLTHGDGKSDSLPVLIKAMEFFRMKLTDINNQLGKINRNEKKIASETARLNARLIDLKTYRNSETPVKKYEPVHQLIVTVSCEEPVTASVDVSYMVSQAGWTPSYDLRSGTTSEPVEITYKANVFQNSGEEWTDVKLKLSTSNPNRSNVKPALPPWYLSYFTPKKELTLSLGARSINDGNMAGSAELEREEAQKSLDKMSAADNAANYSQLIETMTNVEFDIKLSYSIPSDGINHIVSIKKSELPAEYYHFLVPKIDREAFLIARVTGWENLNLLPGRANIFYEGTYVGETVLNPTVLNDTMEIALGRDNGITITRTKLPVKESNKLLGNDITKTFTYELKMKNNKAKTVNLTIEDQIPLSNNKEIKVEVMDNGKAEYNDKTGLLKWKTSVGTREYKSFSFTYAVTHNKDMPLSMY